MSHPFLWGFTAGWWACALLFCIALAIWWLRRPVNTPMAHALPPTLRVAPPTPQCRAAREPDKFRCIDCGSFVDRNEMSWGLCTACQVEARRKTTAVTDWDVAQQAEGQPLYMYGIGIEDFE